MPTRAVTSRLPSLEQMNTADAMKRLGVSARDVEALRERVLGYEKGSVPVKGLTQREVEVFAAMGRCARSRTIAEELGISPKTLDIHRASVCEKLGVTSAGVVRAWLLWCLFGKGG